MKLKLSNDFVYQLFALLISVIVVHAVYVTAIRPAAEDALEQRQALLAQDPDAQTERSVAVILKDLEQEVCFILMLWAMALLAMKVWRLIVNAASSAMT